MKEVYGVEEYNKLNDVQWDVKAEKCNYITKFEQGDNECGFYVLKIASTYDGEKVVENIKKKDVCFFSNLFFVLFSYFFVLYDACT